MSIQEEMESLRRVPLFAKMEPAKLKLLAFASERVTYGPEQELFHQGDIADAAYILLDGTAAVTVDTPNGPLNVAAMGKNDFVGEIGVLCDIPRTATVTATSQLVTLKISKDLFLRMLADFPAVSLEVIRELAHRLELTTIALREARARADGVGQRA